MPINEIKDTIKKFLAEELIVVERHDDPVLEFIRLNKCKNCDRYDSKKDKCGVCGCLMSVKSKTLTNRNPTKLRIETTHCPLGRWNDKETANHYRVIDNKELL